MTIKSIVINDYPYNPKKRESFRTGPIKNIIESHYNRDPHSIRLVVDNIRKYLPLLAKITWDEQSQKEPFYNNSLINPLDGAMIYSTLAQRNPRYYVEIGSGNSTKFAARSIKDNGLRTRIISIDPAPRAEIDGLVHHVERMPLENMSHDIFRSLTAADIVLVDSSHRVFANSDVQVFFGEILPLLPAGLLYAIHDIRLPDEMFPERYYNEQYMLATWLLAGSDDDSIYFSPNFIGTYTDLLSNLNFTTFDGKAIDLHICGGFFWMLRKGQSLTRATSSTCVSYANNDGAISDARYLVDSLYSVSASIEALAQSLATTAEPNTVTDTVSYPDTAATPTDKRSSINPAKKIYRQGTCDSFEEMPLDINWALTNMCNYNCSYCFGHDQLDKSKFCSFADLKRALGYIRELDRKSYSFCLTGGEPTTHPSFYEFINEISTIFKDRLNDIFIISNGSRQESFYDKLKDIATYTNINLNISLHTEFLDEAHIISLITNLANSVAINFSLMYHPEKIPYIKNLHKKLLQLRSRYPFHCSILLLRGGKDFTEHDSRYRPEDFAWRNQANGSFVAVGAASGFPFYWRKKKGQQLFWDYEYNGTRIYEIPNDVDKGNRMQEGFLAFKGMWCAAGPNLLSISPEGFAKGTVCGYSATACNIFRENPYLNKDFLRCVKCGDANCGCSANLPILKFASKEEGDNYIRQFKLWQDAKILS